MVGSFPSLSSKGSFSYLFFSFFPSLLVSTKSGIPGFPSTSGPQLEALLMVSAIDLLSSWEAIVFYPPHIRFFWSHVPFSPLFGEESEGHHLWMLYFPLGNGRSRHVLLVVFFPCTFHSLPPPLSFFLIQVLPSPFCSMSPSFDFFFLWIDPCL